MVSNFLEFLGKATYIIGSGDLDVLYGSGDNPDPLTYLTIFGDATLAFLNYSKNRGSSLFLTTITFYLLYWFFLFSSSKYKLS